MQLFPSLLQQATFSIVLLLAAASAQALNFGFTVEFHSGPLSGEQHSGTFSMDTTVDGWIRPNNGFQHFYMVIHGNEFNMADDEAFPDMPAAGYNSELYKLDYWADFDAQLSVFWWPNNANYVQYHGPGEDSSFGEVVSIWIQPDVLDPFNSYAIKQPTDRAMVDLKLLSAAASAETTVQASSRSKDYRQPPQHKKVLVRPMD